MDRYLPPAGLLWTERPGPTVLNGTVPLVLHLLAPNGRDVQVTSDLAGFWERTYPQVRKSLSPAVSQARLARRPRCVLGVQPKPLAR